MENPFVVLEERLSKIESLLMQIRHNQPVDQLEEKLLTVDETAKYLNVSKPTIYRKISERLIPFHKMGGRIYFIKNELIKFIKST